MSIERHLQWQFRIMKLQADYDLYATFYPWKALFVMRRFIRLHKKMIRYYNDEKKQKFQNMSTTKITTASVKVMQSYNYCHFEASISLENDAGIDLKEIDNARKNCQRLTDKAVKQYQIAKEMVAKRSDGKYQMQNFLSEVEKIKKKDEQDRTIKEIAMLKQYEDEKWQSQFEFEYDYEDDNEIKF